MTNRRAFSVFCAAILTVGFALRPAAAQSLLGRCDKLMADAETLGKKVIDCKKALSSDHAVTPDFTKAAATPTAPTAATMDVVVSTGGIPVEVAKAAMAEPKLLDRLQVYYAFQAYEAGSAAPCAQLAPIRWELYCRHVYGQLLFLHGKEASAAEFLKSCRQEPVGDFLTVRKGKLSEFCSLISQNWASRAAVCPQLSQFFEQAPPPGACEAALSSSPSSCSGFEGEQLDNCRDEAAYAKAHKAQDIGACGASDRCRVLMGGGKQVLTKMASELTSPAAQWFLKGGSRPVVKKVPVPVAQPGATPPVAPAAQQSLNFQGFVCAVPLQSAENRRAVGAVLAGARTCLKDVESALTQVDVETAKAIDARSEKLARLEVELTPTFEPAKAPKAPAKAPK